MPYTKAEIVPVNKGFEVRIGDHVIGTSKTDFDARFHMHAINDALGVAYLSGQKHLERMVEKERVELEYQQALAKAKAYIDRQMSDMLSEGGHE